MGGERIDKEKTRKESGEERKLANTETRREREKKEEKQIETEKKGVIENRE